MLGAFYVKRKGFRAKQCLAPKTLYWYYLETAIFCVLIVPSNRVNESV
jgi:hypothetical protein